jgi:hypothetical protein
MIGINQFRLTSAHPASLNLIVRLHMRASLPNPRVAVALRPLDSQIPVVAT